MSSQMYGLSLDWMIGATVVLANTSIVHCSETENPDLFWALCGAGSSFGVVVHYEFDIFEAPDEVINYAGSQLDQDTAQSNYWSDHLPRLQQPKKELDPTEVFITHNPADQAFDFGWG